MVLIYILASAQFLPHYTPASGSVRHAAQRMGSRFGFSLTEIHDDH